MATVTVQLAMAGFTVSSRTSVIQLFVIMFMILRSTSATAYNKKVYTALAGGPPDKILPTKHMN